MSNDFDLIQEKAEKLECFSGGPIGVFAKIGQHCFETLRNLGMRPDQRLLDIGCGCLRNGVWLIPFLDAGNYYGVEPNVEMLTEGLKTFFDEKFLQLKQPHFLSASDFTFRFTDEQQPYFDFALARSIFTHTSRHQMNACFSSLANHMNRGGTFVLSYSPPSDSEAEYSGINWIGKSHESSASGIAKYRGTTIRRIAEFHGFQFDSSRTNRLKNIQQSWLVFRRHYDHA